MRDSGRACLPHTYPSLALSSGDWWWCGLERVESRGWCLEGTSWGGGSIPGEGPLWLALEPLYMPVNTHHFKNKISKEQSIQVSPCRSPSPSLFPQPAPRHKRTAAQLCRGSCTARGATCSETQGVSERHGAWNSTQSCIQVFGRTCLPSSPRRWSIASLLWAQTRKHSSYQLAGLGRALTLPPL